MPAIRGRWSSARASSSAASKCARAAAKSPCSAARMPAPLRDVHPQLRRAVAGRQRRLGQLAALGDVAAGAPVVRDAPDQRQRRLGVAGGGRVADRGADVVVVGVEPRQPVRRGRRCACPPRRPGAARAYARAWRSRTVVGVVELLERVFADGLEHAEAAAVAGEQGVVGERGDAVQRVGAADGFGGLQREAADEHAELGEQALRRARRAGRSSSRSRRAASAGAAGASRGPALSRSSRRVEAVEDLGGGEDLDPGGGELDRQRQPVEPRADLRDPRLVAGLELQPRVDGAGAAQEQRDRGLGRQRAERELVLGRDPQRRAAGDDQLRAGRRREHAAELAAPRPAPARSCRRRRSVCEARAPARARRATRAGSSTAPSAIIRAPSGNAPPSRCASSSANRVLPIPPGPVSVSSRTSRRSSADRRSRGPRRGRAAGRAERAAAAPRARRAGRASASVERRVLGQDRRLELLQLAAGVQPELLDEDVRARAGRPRARRPGGRRGRGRASAARGSARGTGARRSAPRARPTSAAWRPSARSASIRRSSAASRSSSSRSASVAAGPEQRRVDERRPAEQRQRLAQQLAGLRRRRVVGARRPASRSGRGRAGPARASIA